MKIRWTRLALDDLKQISVRIERDRSLDTANRVCGVIYDRIQSLRTNPRLGRRGIREGTRELVIGTLPFIVTYRLRNDEAIEIVRIWHGAQNR